MISLIDEFAGCPLASCLREETLQEITADLPEIDGVKRGDSLANVPGEKLITIVKYPCDCEFETEYTDDLGYVMWHIAYHLAEMNKYFAKVLDSAEVLERLDSGAF